MTARDDHAAPAAPSGAGSEANGDETPDGLREVCAYDRWHDTRYAIGEPTGICGRYLVDGKCPGNPSHWGRAVAAAFPGSTDQTRAEVEALRLAYAALTAPETTIGSWYADPERGVLPVIRSALAGPTDGTRAEVACSDCAGQGHVGGEPYIHLASVHLTVVADSVLAALAALPGPTDETRAEVGQRVDGYDTDADAAAGYMTHVGMLRLRIDHARKALDSGDVGRAHALLVKAERGWADDERQRAAKVRPILEAAGLLIDDHGVITAAPGPRLGLSGDTDGAR